MKKYLTATFAACVFGFPAGFIVSFLLVPFFRKLEPLTGLELAGDGGPAGMAINACMLIFFAGFFLLFRWSLGRKT